jgi:signal transduction histidine kinase
MFSMNRHTPRTRGRSGARRQGGGRRWMPLALLLLSLAIAGYAVHRGQAAVRSQRATAEALLRDYGTFAAWSYSRHVVESLEGAIRSALSPPRVVFLAADNPAPCLEDIHELVTQAADCGCGEPIGGRFTFLLRIAPRLGTSHFVGVAPAAAEWESLAAALIAHARTDYLPNWPFAVLHAATAGTAAAGVDGAADAEVTLAYTRLTNAAGDTVLYGFEIDRTRLAERLDRVFRRPDLLPPSLTHELPNAELLAVTVTSPTGRLLFDAHTATGDEAGASRHAQPAGPRQPQRTVHVPASQTLFAAVGGGTVTASVLPGASGLLIIGGLPSSQVPWLLLVFALSGALALIALSQLRREGQLAALRSDFVSSVSHELRTPLAQVRLFLETLRLGRYDTDAQRDWILSSIDRETKRLAHLVDNVLQFSRSERGAAGALLAPAELAAELREIVAGFAPLAVSRRVTIAVDLDAPVQARIEREGFRQVVLNLLDNAIKYGPAEQTVVVRLRASERRVRIEVEDEGPGIEPAERRAIWQPFRRGARALGSVAVGSGIGLAVVREIVERHEGDVFVTDAPVRGACFVVELPRVAGPLLRETPPAGAAEGQAAAHDAVA